MKQRQSVFVIIAGTNGTGKTTYLKKISGLSSGSKKRTLIIDPDGYEWQNVATINPDQAGMIKEGKAARIVDPLPEDIVTISESGFRNGNLILDDCKFYVRQQIDLAIRKILIRRRQRMLDVFAVTHSLNDVPPSFWTYCTHIVLFKTKDNPERAKRNIPKYGEIKPHIDQVNNHSDHHYFRIIPV